MMGLQSSGTRLLAAVAGSSLLLLSGFRPLAPRRAAANEPVQVWLTTGDQSQLLRRQTDLQFGPSAPSTSTTLTVDEHSSYQTMDGFGAAMTGSAAFLMNRFMSTAQRDSLLAELFTSRGIRLNVLRHSMGASDFSPQGDFTYDDLPAGQTDPQLAQFSLARDQNDLIPMLLAARQKNPDLKIFGSPWTAPAWMKQTFTLRGGWLAPAHYPAYADYFVRYVQGYAALGLPIYAVTLQNEPLNTTTAYPAMRMDAADQINFLKNNLGPAFQAAGLSTKLIVYDHNWNRPDYPNTVFADPQAAQYAAGSAFHCYGGSVSQQSTTRNAYPGKDLWFTECSGTSGSNFGTDLRWNMSNIIIGATRNWAKGCILWNLALNPSHGPTNGGCQNCRGVLTIDDNTGQVTRNVEYYVLGHASKFVQPGAVRIGSSSQAGGIEAVAFRNPDSTRVLIALNNGSAATTFRVAWRGQLLAHTLPAGAVATYQWAAGNALATTAATPAARLQAYPSPSGRELTLTYQSPRAQTASAELLDATGRVVLRRRNLPLQPGPNQLALDVAALPAGPYLLQLGTAEGLVRRRVAIGH